MSWKPRVHPSWIYFQDATSNWHLKTSINFQLHRNIALMTPRNLTTRTPSLSPLNISTLGMLSSFLQKLPTWGGGGGGFRMFSVNFTQSYKLSSAFFEDFHNISLKMEESFKFFKTSPWTHFFLLTRTLMTIRSVTVVMAWWWNVLLGFNGWGAKQVHSITDDLIDLEQVHRSIQGVMGTFSPPKQSRE